MAANMQVLSPLYSVPRPGSRTIISGVRPETSATILARIETYSGRSLKKTRYVSSHSPNASPSSLLQQLTKLFSFMMVHHARSGRSLSYVASNLITFRPQLAFSSIVARLQAAMLFRRSGDKEARSSRAEAMEGAFPKGTSSP